MKRFITAVAICAFLLAGSTTHADTPHVWDGGALGNVWSKAGNWTNDHVPATNDAITITDNAGGSTSIYNSSAAASPFGNFIVGGGMTFQVDKEDIEFSSTSVVGDFTLTGTSTRVMTSGTPLSIDANATITVNSGLTLDMGCMNIDASAAAANLTATVAGSGTFQTGDVVLRSGSSASREPKLIVDSSATNFDPDRFDIIGDDDSHAMLDIDASFTVVSEDANATMMASYVEVDVAASVTAYFKDTRFDADGTLNLTVQGSGETLGDFKTDEFRVEAADDAAITVTKLGTGRVNASSFVIKGSASNSATLTVSAGSIITEE